MVKGKIFAEIVAKVDSSDRGAATEWYLHGSARGNRDEETYVRGQHVIWSTSRVTDVQFVHRVFSVGSAAIQAAWCCFETDREDKASLCVVEPSCLTLFDSAGAMHFVPVPFSVRRVHALPRGLLVTRQLRPNQVCLQ
jgi:hypothetical protein